MEKNVMLIGWTTDDFFDDDTHEIEAFETYEEAKEKGEKLVAIKEIVGYDTYVI